MSRKQKSKKPRGKVMLLEHYPRTLFVYRASGAVVLSEVALTPAQQAMGFETSRGVRKALKRNS